MQNQQTVQREFIARAKMLAHVMTASTNIKVTISGGTPFCSFGHINLPAGDYTDPIFVKMINGWIDHELGHEDETSRNDVVLSKGNQVLAHIFNIVEDVRMEKNRGLKFRGAKLNLAVLAELAIERKYFESPKPENDIGQLIFALILYRGRANIIGQHCLDEFANLAESFLSSLTTPQFADGLCQLIDKIDTLTDSKGSLDLSNEIIEYIKEEQEKHQQPDQANDQQDSDDNQQEDQEDSEGNNDDQQSDNSDADTDEETDDQPSNQQGNDENQNDSDENTDDQQSDDSNVNSDNTDNDTHADPETTDETDENDDSQDSDSNSQQDGKNSDDSDTNNNTPSTASTTQSANAQILEKMEDCKLEDYHEMIAKMIESDVKDQPDVADVTPDANFFESSNDYHYSADHLDIPLARTTSANVFQALHKVLFDIQPDLPVNRVRGKRINSKRFAGIPSGNTRVFTSRVEHEVRQAAVSLVIDASPSMHYELMKTANTVALSFAIALERLNIPFEVVYYGSVDKDTHTYAMYRPKTFEAKLKTQNFAVDSGNWGTPTGQAMQFSLYSLSLRSETNKLMLLLTDGDPDCESQVRKSREIAKTLGVKVVPFGLCTDVVSGFDVNDFVSLSDPTALSPSLRNATKQKLFS